MGLRRRQWADRQTGASGFSINTPDRELPLAAVCGQRVSVATCTCGHGGTHRPQECPLSHEAKVKYRLSDTSGVSFFLACFCAAAL